MERFKRILLKLLFPHIAVVITLVPLATALLIYAFASPDAKEIVQYISYVLSFYALVILSARAPEIYRFCVELKHGNKYIVRYNSDARLRVTLSLAGSLFINVAYSLFQLGLGIYHATSWYYALAAYYILLTVMRLLLFIDVISVNKQEQMKKEWKRYRFCGIMFALMNTVLSAIVFYIVYQNRAFVHHEITVITMATYTFGSLAMAIVNVIKYRKHNSPLYSASKAISLASASVSMLTLENTMIASVGTENDETFRQIMTIITGGVVCVFVLGLAIYMIVNSTKQLKKMKTDGEEISNGR